VTRVDVRRLVCPRCRGRLRFTGEYRHGAIHRGALRCAGCARGWPVDDGLPRLVDAAAVSATDRRMRLVYDWFARIHDPAVRYLLPLLQFGSERALREGYMRRVDLGTLGPHADGAPVSVLEVGIGCGANLPLIHRDLPPALPVDIWGVDLSEGMLARCRARVAQAPYRPVHLLLADAHALPFPDHAFDRVFHVGGIAAFGDPQRALAEMARVARPGTPIVVVDEQLDPRAAGSLYHRLAYAALTLLAPSDGSPVAHLPAAARDVIDEQVSRFYYSLSFRMPAAPEGGYGFGAAPRPPSVAR
jgi:ubiquinone/menaquinone biosynthesis C-methylase UbiE